ncbi:MAG: AraC family transcriptional regulator [Clostridia bacterium]|nr:AraC family transcriptional regulator [Clostridia bacterium]
MEVQITRIDQYYHYLHSSDYVFRGHKHAAWELNSILSGSMEITCENKIIRADAGDIILLPPDFFHRNRVLSPEITEMIVIHFYGELSKGGTSPLYFHMKERETALFDILISVIEQSGCGQLKSHAPNPALCSAAGRGLLEALLLLTCCYDESNRPSESAHSGIYKNAVIYMRENLHRFITIAEISKHCNVGATTLKKIFSVYTGMGVNEYFINMKTDKAKEMLSSGSEISDICDCLGFSSQAYFTRVFKKITGTTPSVFRKVMPEKAAAPDIL